MSLRLRLALWYGGLAGLLILLVCAYSYAVHGRAHYDETDAVLATSAEHVAMELTAAGSVKQRAEVLHASVILGSSMRIYDANGALRVQSSDGSSALAMELRDVQRRSPPPYPAVARLAPPLHSASQHTRTGTFSLVHGRERWRTYTLPLPGGSEHLVAVAPLRTIDASVRRFGALMVLMATVGAAITFLAGWVVAASALRPVSALTDTAGAIARSREFSRRVPGDSLRESRDELGRLAATFNEMLASLEQAYSTQRRFVSDASHELRAPLTSIQANLELLRDRKDMSREEREGAIDEASREASRLARLVADLLALARADAGTALKREHVELDRVLMDVMGEARHLASGQRLEIGSLQPFAIQGDADRIKQLFLILVDNAIKYTPAGGHVAVSLASDGPVVRFTVHDTGIGITAAALDRVFERFFRADPARSRDPGGTGLGLSIARWIAAEHGGTIQLASEPGRGTIATVCLPHSR